MIGGIVTQASFNKSDHGSGHGAGFKQFVGIIGRNNTTTESGIFQLQSTSAERKGENYT